jgi:hypothetical protein
MMASDLLPGEVRESSEPDDAAHWVAVYEELVGFLRRTSPRLSVIERYQRRLAYWRRQRGDLPRAAGGS